MEPDQTRARPEDGAQVDPVVDDLMRAPRSAVDPELDPDPALYVPTVADAPTTPGEGPFPEDPREREERLRAAAAEDDVEVREGDVEPLEGDVLGDTGAEVLGGAGGAVTGGVIGAIVGGPVGAVAGGVIGAGAGAFAGHVSQGSGAEELAEATGSDDDTSTKGDRTPDPSRAHAIDDDEAVVDHGRRTVDRVDPVDTPRPGAPGPLVIDDDAEMRELDDPDDPRITEDRELNP